MKAREAITFIVFLLAASTDNINPVIQGIFVLSAIVSLYFMARKSEREEESDERIRKRRTVLQDRRHDKGRATGHRKVSAG